MHDCYIYLKEIQPMQTYIFFLSKQMAPHNRTYAEIYILFIQMPPNNTTNINKHIF